MSDNLTGLADANERPNLHYDVTDPKTGKVYGPHKTIYNRFVRWSRLGVFNKIFAPDRRQCLGRAARRSVVLRTVG
jgi:hypothetical protein